MSVTERDRTMMQDGALQKTSDAWPSVALADAPLEIIDGDRGKNYPKQHEFLRSGHCLFLNAGNVTVDGFNLSSCSFISSGRDQRLGKGKLTLHDIILTTRGTIGNTAHLSESVPYQHVRINSGMVVLRPSKMELDPRFLYLVTRSPQFRSQVQSLSTGSAQPQLPIRDIKQINIPLPPLPEQRAIAHVLGTLDDKIELNRRMNQTLEEMARALFKSWFVDFDPVRAKAALKQHALRHHAAPVGEPSGDGAAPAGEWTVERARAYLAGMDQQFVDLFPDRLVDSELGEIPEGWEAADIGSLCVSITSGGTPARRNSTFWDHGTIPWYKTGELLDGPLIDSDEHITVAALNNSSAKLWPAGTVLFALYASPTVGRLGVLANPGTANQAAAGLVAKPEYGTPFLRRLLIEARTGVQSIAVGAAQQNINQRVLRNYRIVLPAAAVAQVYSRLMASCDEHQVIFFEDIRTLTALRDSLLPALLSGELGKANSYNTILED